MEEIFHFVRVEGVRLRIGEAEKEKDRPGYHGIRTADAGY
jgi:hypothetical protein